MKQVRSSLFFKLPGWILPGIVLAILCVASFGTWRSASAVDRADDFYSFDGSDLNAFTDEKGDAPGPENNSSEIRDAAGQMNLAGFLPLFDFAGRFAHN